MTELENETLFEADAILGEFVAHYPSNRLRLLIVAGAVLVVIWFVITVALWQVEEGIAATITVIVLAVVTLGAGWYVTHFWNREVILYERGFSYREGSNLAFIQYKDITRIRQQGQRVVYFGGLVSRSTFKFTIMTDQDEIIVLDSLYNRLDELTDRLEKRITVDMLTRAEQQLIMGESIPFTETLTMTGDGLQAQARLLLWDDFKQFRIANGQFIIDSTNQPAWYRIDLTQVDNVRLLIALLHQRQHQIDQEKES